MDFSSEAEAGRAQLDDALYICEDHFKLEEDVENVMKYRLGFSQRLFVKKGVIPHKFDCQKDRHTVHQSTSKGRSLPKKRKVRQILDESPHPSPSLEKDSQPSVEPTPSRVESHENFQDQLNNKKEVACQTKILYKNSSCQTKILYKNSSCQTEPYDSQFEHSKHDSERVSFAFGSGSSFMPSSSGFSSPRIKNRQLKSFKHSSSH